MLPFAEPLSFDLNSIQRRVHHRLYLSFHIREYITQSIIFHQTCSWIVLPRFQLEWRDSNPRPAAYKTAARPIVLRKHSGYGIRTHVHGL